MLTLADHSRFDVQTYRTLSLIGAKTLSNVVRLVHTLASFAGRTQEERKISAVTAVAISTPESALPTTDTPLKKLLTTHSCRDTDP